MLAVLSTRKPLFWIIATAIAATGVWFAISHYTVAFPVAQVDIKISRTQALEEAKNISAQMNLGPQNYRHAAAFETDDATQLYVELEAGGSTAFNQMVTGTLYAPYTWQVRHFVEGDAHELTIAFKPDGTRYGFIEKIAEQTPGPALPVAQAQRLAETAAKEWGVGPDYQIVETAKEERPNGRVDHTFTYELPEKIGGEGRYRYQVTVTGDKVTTVRPYIKVPESFFIHYSALRSGNMNFRQLAYVLVILLYLIIGCYGGLFYLLRRRAVIWKQPIFWALLIAGLSALDSFNGLPLAWMHYDTATSVNNFLFMQIAHIISSFIQTFLVTLLISILVAEGFTRLAFGNKVQLWRVWSKDVAASPTILGQTVAGYLLVGAEVGFSMVLFYIIARNYFGWWVPSQSLADPNVLAMYFPWLHPIAQSLHAGFWEECLFRAVPLGGAALLGDRFGKRKQFLILGMIVQAFIFGAGHAHYAAEPAYARLVELIIPSLIFGALYLGYGLLPIIIAHFTYDTALIALPIFISHAPGIWLDRLLVIAIGLIPLWIVLYRRIQNGRWADVPTSAYNAAYIPPDQVNNQGVMANQPQSKLLERFGSKTILIASLCCAVAALAAWAILTRFSHDDMPLHITRSTAIAKAQEELIKHHVQLPDTWRTLATVYAQPNPTDRYVWQQFHRPTYRELMHDFYLTPPGWLVRFATWHGPLADRAENYVVNVSGDGNIINYHHEWPQHKPGASLKEQEARTLAHKALEAQGFKVADWKEMGATSEKEPARMDWHLLFERINNVEEQESSPRLRIAITICGDEIIHMKRHVHVPEQWVRQDTDQLRLRNSIQQLTKLFGLALIGLAALYAFITFQWSGSILLMLFLAFLALGVINFINASPTLLFMLSPSQSIIAQLFRSISMGLTITILLAGLQALIFAWAYTVTRKKDGPLAMANIGLAATLGTLGAFVIAGINCITNHYAPSWASYETAAFAYPLIGTSLHVVAAFTGLLTMLVAWALFCNLVSSYQRPLAMLGVGLLTAITAADLTRGALDQTIVGWLIGALGFGIILAIGYYLLYRYDLRLTIPTAATYVTIAHIKPLILNVYPGAWLGTLTGLVMVGMLSYAMVYLLQKRE